MTISILPLVSDNNKCLEIGSSSGIDNACDGYDSDNRGISVHTRSL